MRLQDLRPVAAALALAVLTGSSAWAAAASAAAADVSAVFGPRVIANPHFKAPMFTGDFDGDGVADAVYLVTVLPASAKNRLAPDVTVIDGVFDGAAPMGAQGEKTVLAIVQQGGKRKFLVTGGASQGPDSPGYFDTPIWTARYTPLKLARRGSKTFRYFNEQERRIKNDVIVVGTEAGIDTALYWNGKTYVLFSPNEEP